METEGSLLPFRAATCPYS